MLGFDSLPACGWIFFVLLFQFLAVLLVVFANLLLPTQFALFCRSSLISARSILKATALTASAARIAIESLILSPAKHFVLKA